MDTLDSMATADIKGTLVEKYKASSFREKGKARIHEILSMVRTQKTSNTDLQFNAVCYRFKSGLATFQRGLTENTGELEAKQHGRSS